jgi:hypothetical protein
VELDVYNVSNLLLVASDCNARQLVDVCVTRIRAIYDIISLTPEWLELPEEVKKLVTEIYPDY